MIPLISWLEISIGLYSLGIIIVFLLPAKRAPLIIACCGGLGSLALFFSAISGFLAATPVHASLWTIPAVGKLTVSVDCLTSFFLLVTALTAMPASIFAGSHLPGEQLRHPVSFAAIYLGLLTSLILVLTAADLFLFLVSWELMSILIYLLVNSGKKERPGFLMLAIGEAGTLAILTGLLLLAGSGNDLTFAALKAGGTNLTTGIQWTIFILTFFGFGIKAGLVPFNYWLPRAYTAAPNSCIPLIAGATLNMGFYGIIRINADLLPISLTGAGIIMLIIGAITALIGILYATIEDNFKTLLAHSSIENAGIITIALGAGTVFLTTGHRIPASLAFIAAFYHLLNHSIFKTLLFMGVGVVEHSTGSLSLDKLGGLLKRMPWTGFFVLVGVMAISAMPPLNGFTSEWLTIQSLLRSVDLNSLGVKIAFVTAGVGLALTAGLAVTCFVRAFAMGFLGIPRSQMAKNAQEINKSTLLPMAFLAFTCLALGVLPSYVIPVIGQVVTPITQADGAKALVPDFFNNQTAKNKLPKEFTSEFHDLGAQIGSSTLPGKGLAIIHRGGEKNPVVFAMSTSYMSVTLLILLSLCAGCTWLFAARHRTTKRRPRWDGGIKHLFPEMTYTATGFAQPVRVIFATILRPEKKASYETIADHFRVKIQQEHTEVHLIDRLILYPFAKGMRRISARLAGMHGGHINTYAGYALFTLVIFLIIASVTSP